MERIREYISSGKMKPGDKLPTEADLSEMFGVGRSSIREAIKVFNYLGVFESQTKKGTRLCDHSRISSEALTWSFLLGNKELGDLLDLRKAIEQECWLILLSYKAADPAYFAEMIHRLREKIAIMDVSYKKNDAEALSEADYDFHLAVVESTRNHQFLVLFQTLGSFTREEIFKANKLRKRSRVLITEHEELVDALAAGNRESLFELFRIHIDNAKKRIETLNQ